MDNKPIIALDFSTMEEVQGFLNHFKNRHLNLKVGMELYYQQGPAIIYLLKESEHAVFLDLKFHDIPTTVKKAMSGLASLEVDMVNVHASGGVNMMEAAREGLEKGTSARMKRPELLAVTQLTSTTEEMVRDEQHVAITLEESVIYYSQMAARAGVDGVVCSVDEANKIKEQVSEKFLRVTPGIRLTHDSGHDQHRIATPGTARNNGSTHIVVGRSITQSSDPLKTYLEVRRQWKGD